jgi:hypothetical protein
VEKQMARVKVDPASAADTRVAPPSAEEEEGAGGSEAPAGADGDFQGEDFHDWLLRHGGLNGGWTQDDHMVMVRLTHR